MPYRWWACLLSARQLATRVTFFAAMMACVVLAPEKPASAHEEPDDPDASGTAVHYESVLEGYEQIEIVKKPDDWRAANDLAEELDGPLGQLLEPGAKPERKKKP